MIKFLKITSAINNKSLLIKTDLIASVEESFILCANTETTIRKITFVDDCLTEEYALEPLLYFENALCNS